MTAPDDDEHSPELCAAGRCSHAVSERVPCRCPRCNSWSAEQVQRMRHDAALARVGALSEISARFTTRTFETFVSHPRYEAALAAAREVVEDPRLGLGLWGPVGVGKSHLGAAIVNACVERKIPACFISVDNMLSAIRATYDDGSHRFSEHELVNRYAEAPVLVLDDFGKERLTGWTVTTLFTLVNKRYEHSLPLVVTTNFSPKDLAGREVAADAEIDTYIGTIDRIKEMVGKGRWFSIAGRSLR